jgi:hypothetical protein
MTRAWVLAAIGCFAVLPVRAASPDPKSLIVPAAEMARARELIRQLSSEVYKEREQAQTGLAKMGRLARPALTEALAKDTNPEVRSRASRLLPRAEAADLQARIETFLADAEGKFQHDLPGWNLLRAATPGKEKDPSAAQSIRKLYVDAIKTPANLELLTSFTSGSEAAGRAIADRRLSLFLQQNPNAFGRFIPGGNTVARQPSLADIAVLLLAESIVDEKDIPRNGPFSYATGAQFVNLEPAVQAVNNPDGAPLGKAYRQVFLRWLDTRTGPDVLSNTLWVTTRFPQLKEARALLHRVLKTEGVAPYAKAQAMINLLQCGKEELPALKTQLNNNSDLGNGRIQIGNLNGVTFDCQVRDVALALILHTEGQDLRAYGFAFQNNMRVNNIAQNYWGYGFKSEADRAAAHKKYREYEADRKKNPQKYQKKDVKPIPKTAEPVPLPAKK